MNVVERAISLKGIGTEQGLADSLAKITGHPYKQGHVSYWKRVGYFPPDIAEIVAVHIFDGEITSHEACPKIKQHVAAVA